MRLKNKFSKTSLLCVLCFAIVFRFAYYTNNDVNGYNATSWDAFGYYAYLPATFIYKDVSKLKWYPKMEEKYTLSGGSFYQADTLKNKNLVFKYLGGVAIMQSPFFFMAHAVAHVSGAPKDGFSEPYQYGIMWGAVFWFFVGLLVLYKVLLRYFSDTVVAISLILLTLCSNLIQYVSVDGAMSHAYIFPLYAFLILLTDNWHRNPNRKLIFLIGLVMGLASISRPTELVMIFITILWQFDKDKFNSSKWRYLVRNKSQIFFAILGFFLAILPQLIYWKITTGHFIHNVGSKWFFLNPWFRVLFGFTNGWFVYTPIAIALFLGLFMQKSKPYRKAFIVFGLLNVWIIIAWSDWQYGATYSCRALTQSYPVYVFGLAAVVRFCLKNKYKLVFLGVSLFLIFLNIFQLWQYNKLILHYRDMNFSYYKAIFLDHDPMPVDFSLLDAGIEKPSHFQTLKTIYWKKKSIEINDQTVIVSSKIPPGVQLIHCELDLDFSKLKIVQSGNYSLHFFKNGTYLTTHKFRLSKPRIIGETVYKYESYIPKINQSDSLVFTIEAFELFAFYPKLKLEMGK